MNSDKLTVILTAKLARLTCTTCGAGVKFFSLVSTKWQISRLMTCRGCIFDCFLSNWCWSFQVCFWRTCEEASDTPVTLAACKNEQFLKISSATNFEDFNNLGILLLSEIMQLWETATRCLKKTIILKRSYVTFERKVPLSKNTILICSSNIYGPKAYPCYMGHVTHLP